jgi:hypothetical protein
MSENILEILKLSGLNKLAEDAKISTEEMQLASNIINPPPAPMPPMPPMPMDQPVPSNQRPMNVQPADPERFAKIQNMINAFETPSSYDNILAERMQPTMQAKAGTEGMVADIMDKVVREIRQEAFGTTKQPKQINGLASLKSAIG